jgi:hypothetical protein
LAGDKKIGRVLFFKERGNLKCLIIVLCVRYVKVLALFAIVFVSAVRAKGELIVPGVNRRDLLNVLIVMEQVRGLYF